MLPIIEVVRWLEGGWKLVMFSLKNQKIPNPGILLLGPLFQPSTRSRRAISRVRRASRYYHGNLPFIISDDL